jgi:hypothetical protein
MRSTLEALEDLGVRDQVKVIVGGGPVTDVFAKEIDADRYAPDAGRAVALARGLLWRDAKQPTTSASTWRRSSCAGGGGSPRSARREQNPLPIPVRSAVGAGKTHGRKRCPHGSLCGLTMRTAVSMWWARGARTPFGPAPAAPLAPLVGCLRASGPRPCGCELTRRLALPPTSRSVCIDSLCDNGRLGTLRSAGSATRFADASAR